MSNDSDGGTALQARAKGATTDEAEQDQLSLEVGGTCESLWHDRVAIGFNWMKQLQIEMRSKREEASEQCNALTKGQSVATRSID